MKKVIFYLGLLLLATQSIAQPVSRSAVYQLWKNRNVPPAADITKTWASFHNLIDDGYPWVLSGNAITTNTNFIGPTTNRAFHIKTNTSGATKSDFKIDSLGMVRIIADTNSYTYPFRILGSYQNNPYMELNGINIGGYLITNRATGKTWSFQNQTYGGGALGLDGAGIGITSNPAESFIALTKRGALTIQAYRSNVIKTMLALDTVGRVSQTQNGYSTIFGFNAGALDAISTNSNTIFGNQAAPLNTAGLVNCYFGANAGLNHTGSSVVDIGYNSGKLGTTGGNNTNIGESAGRDNLTGGNNTWVGKAAGLSSTGDGNIGIGFDAGRYFTTLGANRLFINGIDRSNIAGDSTKSILYGYQHATASSQRLYCNAQVSVSSTFSVGSGLIYGTTGANFLQLDNGIGSKLAYNSNNLLFVGNSSANLTLNGGAIITANTGGIAVTGTVQVGDGVVGAPSYAFTSATNTGWYYAGGTPRFAVAGTKILELFSSGLLVGTSPQIKSAAHTAALPAYSQSGDTDTGIGSSVANEEEISCAGVRVANFSSGGVAITGAVSFSDKGINTTAGDGATINSTAGRFRKDATGATFTLTDSFITANSIILLTAANGAIDATATGWTISAGAGSATITFNTAPTANFDMNFFLVN